MAVYSHSRRRRCRRSVAGLYGRRIRANHFDSGRGDVIAAESLAMIESDTVIASSEDGAPIMLRSGIAKIAHGIVLIRWHIELTVVVNLIGAFTTVISSLKNGRCNKAAKFAVRVFASERCGHYMCPFIPSESFRYSLLKLAALL
jgi:hypothetical protein